MWNKYNAMFLKELKKSLGEPYKQFLIKFNFSFLGYSLERILKAVKKLSSQDALHILVFLYSHVYHREILPEYLGSPSKMNLATYLF